MSTSLTCVNCPLGAAGTRCPLVPRKRAPGEVLYVEGEPADGMWLVKRGAVVLSRNAGGVDCSQAVRHHGSLIGVEALVRDTYADTARVQPGTTLCGGSRDVLERWLGPASPARAMLSTMLASTRLDPPRAIGPATGRVARWLLGGPETIDGVPRQTVAQLLGMTPETLSRVLARLAADGVIALTRRTLNVRRREALEALAQAGPAT